MVDLLGFENFLELTSWLILVVDLFGFEDGKAGEGGGIEIGAVEFDGGNLVVVIGSVVKNGVLEVVAGTIDRIFEFVVAEIAATVGLFNGVEDVEELTDAGEFVVSGARVGADEGGFDEAGF